MPQANGEVERFNKTTQEAFLKTQEFHDRVAQENTYWAKKLQSILFAYRIQKQASTHFSPFYMMHGRKPLLPWQMENDLAPLHMSQEVPQVSIEEAIEKMENLHQQVLEVVAGNIKKVQAHQAKTYNAKHARNDLEVGAKVWKKNPLWNTKQQSLKRGPLWRGPYEVEGKTPAGNYLLKGVKGKGKGMVRNTVIPPNQLKRYIARSQNIPAKGDDEYASESDGDDDQGPPIGTNSLVLSDADTILYADFEDDKRIPGHSSGVLIPGCTSSSDETIEIEQIPGHTNGGDSDESIEIDVVGEIPGCTAHGHTMEASEILATLVAGGDPDWLLDLTVPEEPQESLAQVLVALAEDADAEEADAEIPDDTSAETSADAEIPGRTNETSPIIIESSSSNSPVFDDATLEEVDIDLLLHGVTSPEPIIFRPLSLFCRKLAGLQLGVYVGRKSGLGPLMLTYTDEGLICSDNFIEHNILGDGNCFFRTISYLLLGQEVKHDVIRARIVDYIMDPNNIDKLRSYIHQHYPSGEAYIQGDAMADLTTWTTEVELFACAQLSGKDIVCYCHRTWLRYPASGNPRKPTRSAFSIANKIGNHFNPITGMQ